MNERGGSSTPIAAAAAAASGGAELLLKAEGLDKSFFDAGLEVRVLRALELEVRTGEEIAIVGQSGTGKSTLLHVLGSLETPTAGKVYFEGQDLFALGERALAEFRNLKLGFVFQFHYLLADFTALENVMMPALIARKTEQRGRAARGRSAGAGGTRRQATATAGRAFRRRAATRSGGARGGAASAAGAGR